MSPSLQASWPLDSSWKNEALKKNLVIYAWQFAECPLGVKLDQVALNYCSCSSDR